MSVRQLLIIGRALTSPSCRHDHNDQVNKPTCLDVVSIRACLADIIPLCLDNDPRLIPLSCGGTRDAADADERCPSDAARDPDDFRFWSERQAKRICTAIEQAFSVEYVPEVVLADANLTRLANRILVSTPFWGS